MTDYRTTLLRGGFQYLESARWYDGALWFSDIPAGQVCRLVPGGDLEVMAELEAPSGLGFMPDGTAMVIAQERNALLRIVDGTTELVAELDGAAVKANDMWIDPTGRAYITQIGWDYYGGEEPRGSSVVIVDPDGRIRIGGDGLMCPNGIGLTADGKTLFVAESFGGRITAFDVDDDGGLSGQRIHGQYAPPTEGLVDGLCVDAEGAVWVTFPFQSQIHRIGPDGQVLDRVLGTSPEDSFLVACALGGESGHTLYALEMSVTPEQMLNHFQGSVGRVVATEVAVPGFASFARQPSSAHLNGA